LLIGSEPLLLLLEMKKEKRISPIKVVSSFLFRYINNYYTSDIFSKNSAYLQQYNYRKKKKQYFVYLKKKDEINCFPYFHNTFYLFSKKKEINKFFARKKKTKNVLTFRTI